MNSCNPTNNMVNNIYLIKSDQEKWINQLKILIVCHPKTEMIVEVDFLFQAVVTLQMYDPNQQPVVDWHKHNTLINQLSIDYLVVHNCKINQNIFFTSKNTFNHRLNVILITQQILQNLDVDLLVDHYFVTLLESICCLDYFLPNHIHPAEAFAD